jgi:hypothetical protein
MLAGSRSCKSGLRASRYALEELGVIVYRDRGARFAAGNAVRPHHREGVGAACKRLQYVPAGGYPNVVNMVRDAGRIASWFRGLSF